jgi:hypothetical protein
MASPTISLRLDSVVGPGLGTGQEPVGNRSATGGPSPKKCGSGLQT